MGQLTDAQTDKDVCRKSKPQANKFWGDCDLAHEVKDNT